jgi:hypothetical protein
MFCRVDWTRQENDAAGSNESRYEEAVRNEDLFYTHVGSPFGHWTLPGSRHYRTHPSSHGFLLANFHRKEIASMRARKATRDSYKTAFPVE